MVTHGSPLRTLIILSMLKILQTLFENTLLLNFTFEQVKVERYLLLKKVKVAQSRGDFAKTDCSQKRIFRLEISK